MASPSAFNARTALGRAVVAVGSFVALGSFGPAPRVASAAALPAGEHSAFESVGALFAIGGDESLMLRCTGTLLEPDVVLTTANCLRGEGGPLPAERLVFVPHRRPYPVYDKRRHVGRTSVLHHDFQLANIEQTPLAMRMSRNKKERAALERAEKLCGERPTDLRVWLKCVLDQPVEVALSLGLASATDGEHDLGLLFLHESEADARPGFVDPQHSEQSLWTRVGPHGHSPVHNDDELTIVGFGPAVREPLAWWQPAYTGRLLADLFFANVERRDQVSKAIKVQPHEFQLGRGAATCIADSGAGVFRKRHGGAQKLVGMVTRRVAVWQEGPCGDSATVVQIAHYLPWITETLAQACRDGTRDALVCASSPVSGHAKTAE